MHENKTIQYFDFIYIRRTPHLQRGSAHMQKKVHTHTYKKNIRIKKQLFLFYYMNTIIKDPVLSLLSHDFP